MTQRTISSLTEVELRRTFDPGAISRGKPYAHAGRVTVREIEDDGRTARGDVRGGGSEAYSTTVRVSEVPAGVRIVASCSCPVMIDCKHAVALILAVRNSIEPAEPAPIAAPQTAVPAWKTALGPLAQRGSGAAPAVEWALQIDLAGTGRYGIGRLSARPMRRGARGGWVKSGATWSDVEGAAAATAIDKGQAAALRDLRAAEKALSYTYGYGTAAGELDLAALTPEAWRALDRLVESGVTLLGPLKSSVEIGTEPVAVGLGIARAESGDLDVRATLGDAELTADWDRGHTALIGQPAHGIASWDAQNPTRLRLTRFDRPIDDTVRSLLSSRRPVRVPPEDADEFLRDYYPRIARVVERISVDPGIPVPDIAPPRLSVTVSHDGLTAEMRWGFAYAIDGKTVRAPLGTGREPFRDAQVERDLVDGFVAPDVGLTLTYADAAGRAKLLPSVTVKDYDAVMLTDQLLLPALTAVGVDVHLVGGRPDFRLSEADPVVHVALVDGEEKGSDWYDLDVTVTIEGEKVPFDRLFAALAAGETHLVLPSGTYLPIDRPELLRLRELIDEARHLTDRRSGQLRVNRYHAGLWDELVNLGTVDRQSASWQKAVGSLQQIEDLDRPDVPAGIDAELRSYQLDGYAWLCFLVDHGLGGILADDMGLGKTLQTLAAIVRQVDRGSGPWLVVAPTSVVSNWEREAHRFAPGLEVATITSSRAKRRTDLTEAIVGADLVVTSYALFRIEHEAYAQRTWAGLVLDEAQFVKNHQGKTYQCARRLDAPFKLAITGTPLENSLMDLWSMLSIVAPGLFPDPKRFVEHYQKPIENGDRERLALLQRRVRPLMRRRTKDEVASDLPTKTEQVLDVPLSARHADIYETHLQRERQKVLGLLDEDEDGNRFEVLRSLTRLRQLSLDPGLVDEEYDDVGSAKIDLLVEHLLEVTAEGHGALVFSQFTSYLARVRARLDDAGISYSYLDGSTRNRPAAVDAFRAGETTVFLISLKAGGVGLNLVEADYVYVLDPWWNPASEAQAVDRAHRIGQTRPVMVYRLVSTDTIEEKVMELKARKAALFDAVMDGGAALSGALTSDDIRGLLKA